MREQRADRAAIGAAGVGVGVEVAEHDAGRAFREAAAAALVVEDPARAPRITRIEVVAPERDLGRVAQAVAVLRPVERGRRRVR
jgi:hypothetical protein